MAVRKLITGTTMYTIACICEGSANYSKELYLKRFSSSGHALIITEEQNNMFLTQLLKLILIGSPDLHDKSVKCVQIIAALIMLMDKKNER